MKPLRLQFHIGPQTTNAPVLEKLAISVLNARSLLCDPGLRVYQLPDGTLLEFYGPMGFDPSKLFETGTLVISFNVEDLSQAIKQLLNSGAQLLEELTPLCDTGDFYYLRLPDGIIIGLHQ